jgi:hypothetical protein
MKLHRFLPGRGSAGAWRHQDDTGTVAPRKPRSSRAPADRKALARSRLCNGKDLLPNLGGACPRREAATRPFGALLGARTVGRPSDSAGCRLYLDLWANILSHPRWDRASDLSSPDRRLCAVFFVSVLKRSILGWFLLPPADCGSAVRAASSATRSRPGWRLFRERAARHLRYVRVPGDRDHPFQAIVITHSRAS